jgi:multidrug efflux system membrane fusion protein
VTAQKGNIGVYVDSIGTVTPVYTSSITSQVNGIVTQVHYTEGQQVQKGDPLIEIDSRSYSATLAQAKGILERDNGILAQAQMDLARYQAAWARNAIPKQTLDDQEKQVQQIQGTVHNDEGRYSTTRSRCSSATSFRRSPEGWGCGWWTRATS